MNPQAFHFRQIKAQDISDGSFAGEPFDRSAHAVAAEIVADIHQHGEVAIRRYAEKWDGLSPDQALIDTRGDLETAEKRLSTETRDVLQRTADQIRRFAGAQRDCLLDCDTTIDNGTAGHRWIPLESAGCYAPGGRYPLPSSVLMTVVTARAAGVGDVWVASPRPTLETQAAAAIAGASGLLRIGGAQAIAAFAFGIPGQLPACDVIVGPGNQFVTAAKSLVSHTTRIDMLAGPSELVVVASSDADARYVAADLLAQAEHDIDARPLLITDSAELANLVLEQLAAQIATLPTASVAAQALGNGGYLIVDNVDEAVELCRRLAPEHLALQGRKFEQMADEFPCAGALFIGGTSAEVFGDYGAGPNHVLPTGRTARHTSGLSVGNFLRFQTRLALHPTSQLDRQIVDAARLARVEGLEAHARSAEIRLTSAKKTAPA